MRLIILRGLPGSGKSVIAEKLSERLNSSVIFGDTFKRSFMKENIDFKNEEVYKYSYDKIFEKIKELFENKEDIIIVEEIFSDKDLIEKVKDFSQEKNIEIKSFLIERDLEKLLEVEERRERKIKNTKEDFKKLEQEIKNIKIKNEIVVDNNKKIEDLVNFILKNI